MVQNPTETVGWKSAAHSTIVGDALKLVRKALTLRTQRSAEDAEEEKWIFNLSALCAPPRPLRLNFESLTAKKCQKSQSIDQSADAFVHSGNIEIQQIAEAVTAEPEIADKLSPMDF